MKIVKNDITGELYEVSYGRDSCDIMDLMSIGPIVASTPFLRKLTREEIEEHNRRSFPERKSYPATTYISVTFAERQTLSAGPESKGGLRQT